MEAEFPTLSTSTSGPSRHRPLRGSAAQTNPAALRSSAKNCRDNVPGESSFFTIVNARGCNGCLRIITSRPEFQYEPRNAFANGTMTCAVSAGVAKHIPLEVQIFATSQRQIS